MPDAPFLVPPIDFSSGVLAPQNTLVVHGCWQSLCVGRTIGENLWGRSEGRQFKGFRFSVANEQNKHQHRNHQRQRSNGEPPHGLGFGFWTEACGGQAVPFFSAQILARKANKIGSFG